MNSAERPHSNANSLVISVLRRSPVFCISKPFLRKFITASEHTRERARCAGRDPGPPRDLARQGLPRRAGKEARRPLQGELREVRERGCGRRGASRATVVRAISGWFRLRENHPREGAEEVRQPAIASRVARGIALETTRTSTMILMIVAFSAVLGQILTFLNVPQGLAQLVADLEVNRWVVFLIMNLLFLGFFIPPVA